MKIVVLDGYTENPGDLSWSELEKLGSVTAYDRTAYAESPLIAERIGDAEIVVMNKTPISRETIDKCPNIKLIAVLATGYNVVDYNYAREKGINHIVTGVSQTDFSGYPDCRDTFIKSLNVTLNLAMDGQFVFHTPLMWIDKAETWALADELGVLDLIRHETLTCYNGIPGDGCGHCPACKLRREGLEKYLAGKG